MSKGSTTNSFDILMICLLVSLCVTFCGEPDLYDAVVFALTGGNLQ